MSFGKTFLYVLKFQRGCKNIISKFQIISQGYQK